MAAKLDKEKSPLLDAQPTSDDDDSKDEQKQNQLDLYNSLPSDMGGDERRKLSEFEIDHFDGIDKAAAHDDHDDHEHKKQSFLLCQVTIFIYAFVTILVIQYFPKSQDSGDELKIQSSHKMYAPMVGWFNFTLGMNVIACIIGIIGVFIKKPILMKICWILLTVMLAITLILVIAYLLPSGDGIDQESSRRCAAFAGGSIAVDDCHSSTKYQLTWQIVGLTILYISIASFGVHVIYKSEKEIKECMDHMMINDEHAQFDEEPLENDQDSGSDLSLSDLDKKDN